MVHNYRTLLKILLCIFFFLPVGFYISQWYQRKNCLLSVHLMNMEILEVFAGHHCKLVYKNL